MKNKHHKSLPYKKRLTKTIAGTGRENFATKHHKMPLFLGHENQQAAIVYQSELDYLSRCILDYPNIETGGQLFGFYTAKGTPVVCYAIGAGLRANHQVTFFNQDVGYLQDVGNVLVREMGLQHIGEWHSHHQLGLSSPSGHDYNTVRSTVEEQHLGNFLLCIGTCTRTAATINGFLFREGEHSCTPIKWLVKAMESPYRPVIDKRLEGVVIHPHTSIPSLEKMRIAGITLAQGSDNTLLLRAYKDIQL